MQNITREETFSSLDKNHQRFNSPKYTSFQRLNNNNNNNKDSPATGTCINFHLKQMLISFIIYLHFFFFYQRQKM